MTPLDPPVHPFSDPDDIRRWIEKLHAMRQDRGDDPTALAEITDRIRDAESWLDFRGYGGIGGEAGRSGEEDRFR